MAMTPNLRGALLSLGAFVAYACSDVSIKALGMGMSSLQVMLVAACCTLPFVVTQILAMDRRASLWPQLPGLTFLRVVIGLLGSGFVTYTFTHLPLEQCYAIFFTMPLMITLIAWPMLGEPIDPWRGLIILVGFGGVLIALQPGTTTFQLGHLTAICGAVTGALNSLLLRKIGHREKAGVILLYPVLGQMLGAGLLILLHPAIAGLLGPSVVQPFVWQPLTAHGLQVGLMLGFLGTAGGFLIIAAYRAAASIVVAPMQYSQIIWASTLGYLFWGEKPTLMTAAGIAVIIAAGLALLYVAGRPESQRSPA